MEFLLRRDRDVYLVHEAVVMTLLVVVNGVADRVTSGVGVEQLVRAVIGTDGVCPSRRHGRFNHLQVEVREVVTAPGIGRRILVVARLHEHTTVEVITLRAADRVVDDLERGVQHRQVEVINRVAAEVLRVEAVVDQMIAGFDMIQVVGTPGQVFVRTLGDVVLEVIGRSHMQT